MDICLLCLEQRSSPDKGIQVESSQWQDENLDKIIKRHFWPLKTLTLKSWLCSNCWRILHEFHKFHAGIEKAHSCLSMIHELSMVQDHTGIEKAHFCLSMVQVKTENSDIDECEDQEFVNCDVFDPVNTPQLEPQKELDIPIVSTPENENVFINKELDNEPADTEPEIIIPEISLSPVSNTKNDPLQKLPRALENSKISSKQESSMRHKQKKRKVTLEKNANDGAALHAETSTTSKEVAELKSRLYHEEQNKFVSEDYTIKCDICQSKINTFQDVQRHFATYHSKGFENRRLLAKHERMHTIKCDICQSEMNTFQDVQRHFATYHSKGFENRRLLAKHERVHVNAEHVCDVCGKVFPRIGALKNHKLWHSDISCDICGLKLASKRSLEHHKTGMHPEDGQKEFKCHLCPKFYTNALELKTHSSSYKHKTVRDFKCTICENAYKTGCELKEHMGSHTGFVCPHCPKIFAYSSGVRAHCRRYHSEM